MIANTTVANIKHVKIDTTDVFFHNFEHGHGKLTISDVYGHNYSHYWGAMGGDLEEFILKINDDYFANKLMGSKTTQKMDVKKTFTSVRKYIRNEIVPWYKHLKFQKDLREKLNNFQSECNDRPSGEFFVDLFNSSFVNRLDFYTINDYIDREEIKEAFNNIEQWYFIQDTDNEEYIWLKQLHKKLKKSIKQGVKNHE